MVADVAFAERRRRALEAAHAAGADAVLITSGVHLRYLAGFTGSNGALLLTDEAAVLATDGRYLEQAAAEAPGLELVDARDSAPALLPRCTGSLAFEDGAVTVAEHGRWAADWAGEWVGITGSLSELRRRKDPAEVVALREACAVTDRAFDAVLARLAVGWTERRLAAALEAAMREQGADGLAFETIVAAGPNGSRPHHRPTDRPIGSGEFVTCDFGAQVGGYHADMTRTVIVGGPVAAWQEEVYQVVRAAQRLGRQALHPDADTREIDRVARDAISAAGYGDAYPHGLGHGVGLQIHEAPLIGQSTAGRLGEQAVVTVEPGIYLPGVGGVRIEDTLFVGPDGNELLTRTSRELLVV
jgi:Xaa-Pro dipeptidase